MRRRIMDQHGMNYLTLTVVDWVDVFTRKECRDILVSSLDHCREYKGLEIFAYVIMSNHIHLVARAKEEGSTLSDILRDFKKYTSSRIVDWIKTSGTESRREWLLHLFAPSLPKHGLCDSSSRVQVGDVVSDPFAPSLPK